MEKPNYNLIPARVVMLPQQDYFDLAEKGQVNISGIILHGSGFDYYTTMPDQWLNSILNIGGTPQHLYFISERQPEPGEWCICLNGDGSNNLQKTIVKYEPTTSGAKYKIEATTDKTLNFPYSISELYIRKFLSNNNTPVLISLLKSGFSPEKGIGMLQLNQEDNCMEIIPQKQEFTKSEYLQGLEDFAKNILSQYTEKGGIFLPIKELANNWLNEQNF